MSASEERLPRSPQLSIGTAARFLIGDRAAILALASSRWTLAIGALLVLSGGLARNYDHRDLWHEPWHALHGFGVTTLLAVVLFGLVFSVARLKSCSPLPRFWRGFASFLGCLWMMAPMAWPYGVPYERFMLPERAGTMNALTLALVAAWRVALVTRVLAVVFGARATHVFWLIFFVIDTLAFGALLVFADRVIDAMGGNIAPPTQRTAAAWAPLLILASGSMLPASLIGMIVAGIRFQSEWQLAIMLRRRAAPRPNEAARSRIQIRRP